jgi:hypothetical protein
MAKVEKPTKFVIEYKNEQGKVTDRWHYDYSITRNGPILTENLDLPPKQKKKRVAKVKKA